ncbi:hypothetical protein NPIL_619641 [Nephila pilipes]|uniref:Uncharacterized protein n=1 Tax=Nephila pilipes TaxID=299642 RepID=A0A8X6TQE9_NEPPI|nr:hypothetical protein NPIL_619641 [Nephila pilipes]
MYPRVNKEGPVGLNERSGFESTWRETVALEGVINLRGAHCVFALLRILNDSCNRLLDRSCVEAEDTLKLKNLWGCPSEVQRAPWSRRWSTTTRKTCPSCPPSSQLPPSLTVFLCFNERRRKYIPLRGRTLPYSRHNWDHMYFLEAVEAKSGGSLGAKIIKISDGNRTISHELTTTLNLV